MEMMITIFTTVWTILGIFWGYYTIKMYKYSMKYLAKTEQWLDESMNDISEPSENYED